MVITLDLEAEQQLTGKGWLVKEQPGKCHPLRLSRGHNIIPVNKKIIEFKGRGQVGRILTAKHCAWLTSFLQLLYSLHLASPSGVAVYCKEVQPVHNIIVRP